MDEHILKGKAHVYGDNINTDAIIPGKYTKTLDLKTFAEHVMEDLDPNFRTAVAAGDILVAGENFGCGSSREQAPLALKTAGVAAVIATYFARIFFRNAINIGLPVFEVDRFEAFADDQIAIDLQNATIENLTRNRCYQATPMPQVMIDVLNAGGLVNYLLKHGDYMGI